MLLSYVHHASPTGLSDVLSKLATFAAAQVWTVELQTNKDWTDTGGGVYGWTTGTHDFLELVSNGWGAQDLQYRFYQSYDDVSSDTLAYSAINPGAGAYDTISTFPHLQDKWNTSFSSHSIWSKMSVPSTTTPDVWFVGNDKFIAVHWKVAATYVISFSFGTFDLIPELQDRTDLNLFFGGQAYSIADQSGRLWGNATSYLGSWFSCYGYHLYVTTSDGIKWFYYKGAGIAYNTTACWNLRFNTANTDKDPAVPSGDKVNFGVLPGCCVYNSFSQRRVLVRPTMYIKNPNDDGTFIAAGHLPVYFTNVEGLVSGDIIKFSNEEYICFPAFLTSNVYGVAYRIV